MIDWGDAGWGDPMLDFSAVPLAAVPPMLAGYRDETETLDEFAEARIVWDRIRAAIRSVESNARHHLQLEELARFMGSTQLASLV